MTDISADYFFSSPDSFRANIRGILGSTQGALVSIGDSVAAYFPSHDTLFIAVEDSSPNQILGLSIGFNDLIFALVGRIDLSDVPDSAIIVNTLSNSYELIIQRKNDFFRYEILADFSVASEQIFDADGNYTIDISFSNFKKIEGMNRHRKMDIINPVRNESVHIEIQKEKIGGGIPKNIFKLDVPANVKIWRLI